MTNPKATNIADSNMNVTQPSLSCQSRSSLDGPVAIFWDAENCNKPRCVHSEYLAGNVKRALSSITEATVQMFSAYGVPKVIRRKIREGCQRTGINFIDVANGRKDAADKAILVDMFVFALDNRPPSSIMLISGDVDFAPALHKLRECGHTIIVVIPFGVRVSPALTSAGHFVWYWPRVARGIGFIPLTNVLVRPRGEGFVPSGLNEVSGGVVPSGDYLNSSSHILKVQLVKLLELSNGCLPLTQVPSEYQKHYKQPIYGAEDGVRKLVNLFNKMGDPISMERKGDNIFVCLCNRKAGCSARPLILSRKHKIRKGVEEESTDLVPSAGFSTVDHSSSRPVGGLSFPSPEARRFASPPTHLPLEAHHTRQSIGLVTKKSWEELILKGETPVLVEFYKRCCPRCWKVQEVIGEISADYAGRLKCLLLHVDDDPEIAAKHGIKNAPAVLVFKNGVQCESVEGAKPKEIYVAAIERVLQS